MTAVGASFKRPVLPRPRDSLAWRAQVPRGSRGAQHQAPRFLSAGEEERAEPELVAQPPRADQVPIRDQAPERK